MKHCARRSNPLGRLFAAAALMALILVLAVDGTAPDGAFAIATAPVTPSSTTNSGAPAPWGPGDLTLAANDTCINLSVGSGNTGNFIDGAFPNLSIPAGNTIVGVEVQTLHLTGLGTNTARLFKSGAQVGADRLIPAQGSGTCPTSATTGVSSGGPADLWGTTFTPADFDGGAASIHVRLVHTAANASWAIENVKLIVYHNPPNTAPSVPAPTAAPSSTAPEGTAVTASSTFTDPDANTWTCTVNYGDGSGNLAGNVAGKTCTGPAHVYTDDDGSPFNITVTVNDGVAPPVTSGPTAHTVTNVNPVNAGSHSTLPSPALEGSPMQIVVAFTDAGTGDTHTCSANYGPGPAAGVVAEASGSGTCTGASHTFPQNGTFPVTVVTSDDDGGSDTDVYQVVVQNVAPTVLAIQTNPNGTAPEGTPVTALAAFTDPAGTLDQPYTCTVDYGDGSGPQAGMVDQALMTCTGPAHAYGDNNASYTITIAVTDKDGGTGQTTAGYPVTNVPPTVDVPAIDPQFPVTGYPTIVGATFSDPGFLDTWTCTIDYGDGSGPLPGVVSGPVNALVCTGPAHVYLFPGTYTVTVVVTDDDFGTDSETAEIYVTLLQLPNQLPPPPEPTDVALSETSTNKGRIAVRWYEFTVANIGPIDAVGVDIEVDLPAGLRVNRNGLPPECSRSSSQVRCDLGRLNAGQSWTFTVQLYGGATPALLPAEVTAGTPETNTANNVVQ